MKGNNKQINLGKAIIVVALISTIVGTTIYTTYSNEPAPVYESRAHTNVVEVYNGTN